MAAKGASPTAQLLRSSRLFSIPRPLPQISAYGATDTGTTPYPTRQAIARPASSSDPREWGLKRSMPQKVASKRSNTLIHVISHDTDERVTEYSSGSAHTRSLEKWRELNLPMRLHTPQTPGTIVGETRRQPSAFQSTIDTTEVAGTGRDGSSQVWKYDSVPIDRMTDGDFEAFLQGVSKANRGQDFLRFLKERFVQDEVARKRSKTPKDTVFDEESTRRDLRESDAFAKALHTWRNTRQEASSNLNMAIEEFLQLPPRSDASGTRSSQNPSALAAGQMLKLEPYTTHPSAGLSYLTDNNYIDNDPMEGPRHDHQAVQARELAVAPHTLGIAGVAASGAGAGYAKSTIDMETPGGHKHWVIPEYASVNSTGQIIMKLKRASTPAREAAQTRSDETHRAHRVIGEKWQARQARRAKAHAAVAALPTSQQETDANTSWTGLAMLKMHVSKPKKVTKGKARETGNVDAAMAMM